MASSCTSTSTVIFLLVAVTQRCSADSQSSMTRRDIAMVTAMTQNNQALQCFGDALTDGLSSLSDEVLKVKEQIDALNSKFDSVKQGTEDSQKIDSLNQEIADLKNQLGKKDQMVASLSQEITDLKSQVATCSQETTNIKTQLGNKEQEMQDLNKKLSESQQRVHDLEKQVTDLKSPPKVQNIPAWMKDCVQPSNLQQIKTVVEAFNNSGDFAALKAGLGPLLERSSVAYSQLQSSQSLADVGGNGYTQLASLLLCAGMVPDTVDSNEGQTILFEAAKKGQAPIAKFMLDRGANPDGSMIFDMPLFEAAYYGHLDVVKLLVQAGVDTTRRNALGMTALGWARSGGDTAVQQYLQTLPH